MIRKIIADYQFYGEAKRFPISVLLDPLFWLNVVYRVSSIFFHARMFPLAKLFWFLNRVIYCVDIDPGARLAGGFRIIHGLGIVIGREVVSEGPFIIYQGATLGGNSGKKAEYNGRLLYQPYIKSGVVIGINSVVIGPIVLGCNVRVGANAVVTKDVPDNKTVVSNNVIL